MRTIRNYYTNLYYTNQQSTRAKDPYDRKGSLLPIYTCRPCWKFPNSTKKRLFFLSFDHLSATGLTENTKNSTMWVCLYHHWCSLWQCCCCCCCYRRPSGELCPTVVEAEAELVAVDCADWQTAPVETRQTNKQETKWNEKHFYICWNHSRFFIISFGLNSLEKTKGEKGKTLFSFLF